MIVTPHRGAPHLFQSATKLLRRSSTLLRLRGPQPGARSSFEENIMLGFRGLHWIYEATEYNNVIASRARVFEKLVENPAPLEQRDDTYAGQSSTAPGHVGRGDRRLSVGSSRTRQPVANAATAA
jgi:hypothetical protein